MVYRKWFLTSKVLTRVDLGSIRDYRGPEWGEEEWPEVRQ